MGLFSGSTKIYVDSVLYNLAGEEKDRVQYLKTLTIGNILSNNKFDIANTYQSGYLNGPGITLRNYFNWVSKPGIYNTIGIPKSTLVSAPSLDVDIIKNNIPHGSNQSVIVQKTEVDLADFSYWADRWIADNEPELFNTDYNVDFDEATLKITIYREDSSVIEFTPTDFDKDKSYLYVTYNLSSEGEILPEVTGPTNYLDESDPFPSIDDYQIEEETTIIKTTNLTTTTDIHIEYSDNRPDEDDTSSVSIDEDWDEFNGEYYKEQIIGNESGSDSIITRRFYRYDYSGKIKDTDVDVTITNEDIGGGVIKTTTTTVTTESLVSYKWWREDYQDTVIKEWSSLKIFIYEIGSGNTDLDNMVSITELSDSQYYPFIPLRLDNKYITEYPYPQMIDQAAKAYKKLTNNNLNDILVDIDNNDNVEDIDYAYLSFGVSANTIDKSARRYIYEYFKLLMFNQANSSAQYNAWTIAMTSYKNAIAIWEQWKLAQSDPENPLFGTDEPSVPNYPDPPQNKVTIKSTGVMDYNYDMQIMWSDIKETTHSGLGKPDAKIGDIWWNTLNSFDADNSIYTNLLVGFITSQKSINNMELYYQDSHNTYRKLTISNMFHRNYIYQGKYVEITLEEAVNDTEESGFLIPLHYPTFKELPLVHSTQMSSSCMFLVFNCYKVVKQKWYQTGIFKFFVFIAIITVAVATGGIGASGIGLLGTNAAVGSALGLTGTLSILAGVIANSLAAMVVTMVVQQGATLAFGEKFGAFIGAIVSFISLQVAINFQATGSLALNWGNMLSAQNILQLSEASVNGFSQYLNASALEYINKTQTLMEEYSKESKLIKDLFEQNIGYDNGSINPMNLTQVNQIESLDSYLSRTLMTGSDIAEITMDMLTNFADATTSVELKI